MSDSICKFLSPEQDAGNIRTVAFVYETEYKKFKQPFFDASFKLGIVTSGEAVLRTSITEGKLVRGSLFFGLPGNPYYLEGGDDFKFIYVTFIGTGAASLLNEIGVGGSRLFFSGMDELISLFETSIRESKDHNSALLSKGLLYIALSKVAPSDKIKARERETLFSSIVEYVDKHYTDPTLTLGTIAEIYSYTEKYISALFKKHMKIGFNAYLSNLRIQKARELLPLNIASVAEIGQMCGFESPLYFSKVFKKRTGLTPSEHIKAAKALEGDKKTPADPWENHNS